MPIITSIKPQKNGKRVNIYLDDKFSFGLDLDNFVLSGLKAGDELSKIEVGDMINKAEYKKISDKLLRFSVLRPRSEKEINNWLQKYKIPLSFQKKLIVKLKKLDLINDEKFAKWWIEQRLQFRYKSKRELVFELKMKGVDKDIVARVIGELVNSGNEDVMAEKLLKKKEYRWNKLPSYEKKTKMKEYLARKGFAWDTIKKVVDTIAHSE